MLSRERSNGIQYGALLRGDQPRDAVTLAQEIAAIEDRKVRTNLQLREAAGDGSNYPAEIRRRVLKLSPNDFATIEQRSNAELGVIKNRLSLQ